MVNREEQLKRSVELQSLFAPVVQKKLQPALTALNLDYFWYVRLIEGAFHISIGTQAPLVDLYRERKTEDLYYKDLNFLAQKQTTVIWDLYEPTALTHDMKDRIGLKNGMCIFRRKKTYVEVFYVASRNAKSNLYQLYINNTPAIYRLIGFFQEQILPLLPIKNPAFLLPYMDGTLLKLPPPKKMNPEMSDFYDATALQKFTLHQGNEEFKLSLRELQCIHRLSLGESSKEIGSELGISYRTVEHYLEEVRSKTGCKNKIELINLYKKNDHSLWFGD